MSIVDKLSGYEHIRLISPYKVQTISDIRIERKPNEHARLWVTGIIPEEHRDTCIAQATSMDEIEIRLMEDDGERTLFRGLLSNLSVTAVRGIYYMNMEAESYTCLLDIDIQTRTFQNAALRYEDLINRIIAPYSHADCIDQESKGAAIKQCIVQYEETDWEFLQRIASHFGAVLIPDAAANGPKFFFGTPSGRAGEIVNATYQVSKTIREYELAVSFGEKVQSHEQFLVYTVETGQAFNLGDKITYMGEPWRIGASIMYMDRGLLTFRYDLMKEESLRENRRLNMKIIGASLEGKILEVSKDTVRLHLDVDQDQPQSEASWFPYSYFYSAEGNSGFHCMPEKGDAVKLYFPSGREGEAVAMSSVRKGGGSSPKHADPSAKYWGGPNGKEVQLNNTAASLTAKEGSLFIKLEDSGVVTIQSDNAIHMTSVTDMSLGSEKSLYMVAADGIEFTSGTSSIVLDGMTDIQGIQVELEGLIKAPVVVEPMPELDEAEVEIVEAPKPEKKSFWGGLLDKVQVVLDVVGLIPGIGEVADLANAGIYAARGDYLNAGLSLAACIPVGGQAATVAKMANKANTAIKATKAASAVAKAAGAITKAVKVVKAGDRLKSVIDKVQILNNIRKTWSTYGKVKTAARAMMNAIEMTSAFKMMKNVLNATQTFRQGLAKLGGNIMNAYDVSDTLAFAGTELFGLPDFMDNYRFGSFMSQMSTNLGIAAVGGGGRRRGHGGGSGSSGGNHGGSSGGSSGHGNGGSNHGKNGGSDGGRGKPPKDNGDSGHHNDNDGNNHNNDGNNHNNDKNDGKKEKDNGKDKENNSNNGKEKADTDTPPPKKEEAPDKQPEKKESSEGTGEDVVTYRRVQGGEGTKSSQPRVQVNEDGTVTIPEKGTDLNISIDNGEHSNYFNNERRGGNADIVEFDVPKWFDDFLKENTIPQRDYQTNPLNQGGTAPKLVDPTKPGNSFEIPAPWVEWIEEYATNARIKK